MALDSNGLELLNRQPEAHVSVDNMVSILYYSPAVVQPRKPFVQEITPASAAHGEPFRL